MLNSDTQVLIALTKTDWFILLLQVINLASIVFILKSTLNGLEGLNFISKLVILLLLLLDGL